MRLSADECKKLSTHLGNLILADQSIVLKAPKPKIFETIDVVLRHHSDEERRIEERAQSLFNEKQSDYSGMQPGKAISLIKAQIAKEEDFILSGGRETRFSEDKIFHMAHLVADKLYDDDLLDFPDEDDGPKFLKKALIEYFHRENQVDEKVRKKIASLASPPFEGSRDWDILFRKYRDEELKKLGHT